jgi:5-methylcytosine-specific restriction endonuclease McrA
MERLRQKRPRFVLKAQEYDEQKKRALERDGWKCQCCGSPKNLQVHHLVSRGRLGSDVLSNMMTLCAACHRRQHSNLGSNCGG